MKPSRYGLTAKAVREAHAQGLTMPEAAKAHGLSYASVQCTALRLGLKFPRTKGFAGYGDVKQACLAAAEAGLTYGEASKKYGYSRDQFYRGCHYLGITLLRSKHETSA